MARRPEGTMGLRLSQVSSLTKIGAECVHVSSAGQLSNVYMVIQDCVRLRERN